MQQLIDFFGTSQVQWIVILIGVDVVLGILAAIVKNEFKIGMMAGFMKKTVIGYVFGFAVLEMVAQALPQFGFVLPIAFLLVVVALLASCVRNLKKLGLALPFAEKM